MPPVEAADTLSRLHGAFALCFLFDGEDDLMIAARKGSPSPSAGARARCSWGPTPSPGPDDRPDHLSGRGRLGHRHPRRGRDLRRPQRPPRNRAETRIQIDQTRIEKAGYKHFMAKEIAEQPVVIADALKHYTSGDGLR
jgi:glutamine---fructose-6-phosphate transaminase (isomerizing)